MGKQRASMLLLLTADSSIFMCVPVSLNHFFLNMHSKDMKGLIQTRNTSHLKRIDTSICITESLCCTRKTNKTWLINYTPIYKKKKRCPPYTQRKGASLFPRWRDSKKNLNKQDFLSFPQLT